MENGNHFLRLKEICQRIGLSQSTSDRMMKDGTFPPKVSLGPSTLNVDPQSSFGPSLPSQSELYRFCTSSVPPKTRAVLFDPRLAGGQPLSPSGSALIALISIATTDGVLDSFASANALSSKVWRVLSDTSYAMPPERGLSYGVPSGCHRTRCRFLFVHCRYRVDRHRQPCSGQRHVMLV